MAENENGWNEWSRHVLKELERLNDNYEILRQVNEDIKSEMTRIGSLKTDINDLKIWRARIDDVASPAQLKELVVEVENLKLFKGKAIAIFTTVQFIMAFVVWAMKVL
tara:strand:+ start:367 stop:690 length:324 start_codon:yes stop_codon:yes gene_type:complete